jgi:hypothetical protein
MNACKPCDGPAIPLRGTVWHFEDARGIAHRGIVERVSDFGGTDVVHRMMTRCGATVMLSGSRLRAARVMPSE